jgi:5-carboxymethyl-2-hydroxymuconate isomerase
MEDAVDFPALCDLLRRTGIETGVFPMAGIRVRAFRADHVSIADGDPRHGYIDIQVRLRGGRTFEAKKAATEAAVSPRRRPFSIRSLPRGRWRCRWRCATSIRN